MLFLLNSSSSQPHEWVDERVEHRMGAGDPVTEEVGEDKDVVLGGWAGGQKVGRKEDQYVEDLNGQPAEGEHANDGDEHL